MQLSINRKKIHEPILHDSCTPPKAKNVQDNQKGQKPNNFKPKTDSNSGNQGSKRNFRKKSKWVEPWPENKNYMSKSGGSLSRDCETWMRGFCFKCGCNSHSGDVCRTYPEKTPIMSICSICRQGFHETCKSRRMDLKTEFLNKQINHLSDLYAAIKLSQKGSRGGSSKKIVTVTPPTIPSDSDSD